MSATNQSNKHDVLVDKEVLSIPRSTTDITAEVLLKFHSKRLVRRMPKDIKHQFCETVYSLIWPIMDGLDDNERLTSEEALFIDEVLDTPESIRDFVLIDAFAKILHLDSECACEQGGVE